MWRTVRAESSMATPREVREVVRAWIVKAEHDLLTAERTFTPEGDCPFDMVCRPNEPWR